MVERECNAQHASARRLTITRSVKALIASIIIATSVLSLGACNLDAYPCRGPYGEPCGGPRSGWPGAATCPNC